MNQLSQVQLDWMMELVTGWIAHVPAMSILLVVMALDILGGILVAIDRKTLSSSISRRGVALKVYTLMIVALAAVIEPYAQGLPIAQIVALFYCKTEVISILENAAALGLPIPMQITEVLAKLKEGQKAKIEQKSPGFPQAERNIAALEHNSELLQERVNQENKPVDIPLPLPVRIVPMNPNQDAQDVNALHMSPAFSIADAGNTQNRL